MAKGFLGADLGLELGLGPLGVQYFGPKPGTLKSREGSPGGPVHVAPPVGMAGEAQSGSPPPQGGEPALMSSLGPIFQYLMQSGNLGGQSQPMSPMSGGPPPSGGSVGGVNLGGRSPFSMGYKGL